MSKISAVMLAQIIKKKGEKIDEVPKPKYIKQSETEGLHE